jgi:hypothetical protein
MGNGLSLQKKTIQKLFLRSHGSHGKFLEANSYPTDLRISKRFGNSNHPRRYTVTNIYISLYIHIYIWLLYIYISFHTNGFVSVPLQHHPGPPEVPPALVSDLKGGMLLWAVFAKHVPDLVKLRKTIGKP